MCAHFINIARARLPHPLREASRIDDTVVAYGVQRVGVRLKMVFRKLVLRLICNVFFVLANCRELEFFRVLFNWGGGLESADAFYQHY